MTKSSKFLYITLGVIAAIFLIGLAAPLFLNDMVKERIISSIEKQKDFHFQLEIDELDLGIWSRSLEMDSVTLSSDLGSHPKVLQAENLILDGINWFSLLSNTIPEFKSLHLKNPHVTIDTKLPPSGAADSSAAPDQHTPESSISIPVFDLLISDASVTIKEFESVEKLNISDIDIDVEQLNLNAQKDSAASLFKNLELSVQAINGRMPEQLYRFNIEKVTYKNGDINLTGFEFKPLLPRYEFSKRRGKQLDRINLVIPTLNILGLKPESMINGNIHIDSLELADATLEIFRNKRIPRAPSDTLKPLVNDMARSIPIPLELKTAIIENATIIYSEHRPPSDTSASISFNQVNGSIRNFRSASHPKFFQDTLLLHAETMFMNESLLTVDVVYPIFRRDDHHTIQARLDSFDPKAASEMLKYVGFVGINSGMIHGLHAHYSLDDTSSNGELTLIYSNLDISLLNKNDPDRNGIKEALTDFITDNFIIESENTGNDPRIGQIHFERERNKSIFAYWWKSMLSGIKDTVK